MKLIAKTLVGLRPVYDIEVEKVHNFYANGVNVHNCATAGGVSVIKHNGTVVNSNSVQSFVSLKFDQYKMFGSLNGNGLLYRTVVPTKDLHSSFSFSNLSISNAPDISRAAGYKLINNNRNLLRAHIAPLVQGMRVNENTEAASATFAITNTFNTGHLIGDIRRAYLADTDVGSVGPAPNLVTNGTFDTNTDGWNTGQGATLSVDANRLLITNGSFGFAVQGITVVLGKTYILTGTYTAGTATTGRIVSYIGNQNGTATQKDVGSGPFSMVFVGQGVSCPIALQLLSGVAGQTGYFDNISVQEVVADRSYKASGAPITGTLTKTQVAAAASQLVAYSGFSAANYLREPYSADLDFGTGEWSASAWVNVPVDMTGTGFPAIAANLVTNGAFDTDVSGWTSASPLSWDAGRLKFIADAQGKGALQQLSLTVGKTYKVTGTIYGDGSRQVSIGILNNAQLSFIKESPRYYHLSAVPISILFVATETNSYFYAWNGGSGTFYVDNCVVTEVNPVALLADRAHSSGPKINLGVTYEGKLTATAFDGTTTRTVTTTAAYNTGTMINPVVTYTTDGTLAIRVNGAEVAATRGTPLGNMTLGKNLLTFSEQFGQSPWDLNSTTTVTSNSTTAPDGTSTADTLFENTNTSAHYVRTPTFSFVSGSSYAFSIFAKNISGGRGFIQIAVFAGFGSGANVTFNLATGTISASTHFTGSISPVGNGWYRCVAVGTATSSAAERMTISLSDGTTTSFPSYAGDITKGIYLWGAQLELGSTATDYAATNVAPLTIGNSYAADAPFPGSIALLKLSATVPTAEQSQWMYEQEKQMFRDGAQVTLPDAGSIVDLAYDDATDKWLAVSATNESEWSGLVRTSVTASPAGSYSKISAASGIQLQARTTTNPGVDVTIPSYGLREELVNRSQAAARLARSLVPFDYIAGFTANTTSGSTAITSAAGITYAVNYVGARVSGAGIPADTFVAAVSGTTIYLTKAATATASAVQISFNDFILPVGYEAKDVLLAGVSQREGATQAFTRLFDGFKETIRFTTAPSNTAFVQIQATRSIQ